MGYNRIGGMTRRFSIPIRKEQFLSSSGNVFSGDLKIKGRLIIEGDLRAMEIREGSFRTINVE